MPKITMNEKTRDYILKNGGSIRINRTMAGNCWTSAPMVNIRFGEPVEESSYNLYKIDSVNIYVIKGLELKRDSIEIKLSNFLGIFKNLEAYGFKLL